MVGGVLNTATHPNNQQTQYKNFTYEEAKADSKLSDYVDSVNSEMSGIIKKLENSAKNNTTSSNEDW
jgi:phage tail tape-measure protein